MKGSSLLGRLTTQGVTDPEGIWGVDKTAPGRGGGPGACLSEALGGIPTRRGNGSAQEGFGTLSASGFTRWGCRNGRENAFRACALGKNACKNRELYRLRSRRAAFCRRSRR